MPENNHRTVVLGVVSDILNDEELDNLRVKDIRRVVLHLQDRLNTSGKTEEESDEELRDYIL